MSLKNSLTVLIFTKLLFLSFEFWISGAVTGPEHGKVVVCYVVAWSRYRLSRGSFAIEDIDPTLCTHISYAYAGLSMTHDGIISLDPWLTNDEGERSYNRIVGLKQNHPHLKVTLAIGGWVGGSVNYSSMVQDPAKRKRFVNNTLEFVRKYNFDGLDLHWQFPGSRGGVPMDKTKFLFLVKELRLAFSNYNLLLTSIFGIRNEIIEAAYEVPELSNYLDYIHIMNYDIHGSWDQRTGANSPLRSSDRLNVDYIVNHLIKLGAAPSKLILALPMYGRTFILVDEAPETNVKLGSAAKSVGFQGQFSKEDGFIGYNEICLEFQNSTSGYKVYWDEESQTPFAVSGTKAISYDNDRSHLEKIKFAMEQKLGGVMAWSIDSDDFKGDCGAENYPLLRSINKNIVNALANLTEKISMVYLQETDLYSCKITVKDVCES